MSSVGLINGIWRVKKYHFILLISERVSSETVAAHWLSMKNCCLYAFCLNVCYAVVTSLIGVRHDYAGLRFCGHKSDIKLQGGYGQRIYMLIF